MDTAKVGRIPNEVALALVRAEREKAVSSGHVRALPPATQQPEEVPGGEGDDVVTKLQARVERLEAASGNASGSSPRSRWHGTGCWQFRRPRSFASERTASG